MVDMLSAPTFGAALAMTLIIWAAAGRTRRPALALLGWLILGSAVTWRISIADGWLDAGLGATTDLGLAFVVGALVLRRLRRSSRAPLLLGFFLLFLTWGVQATRELGRWLISDIQERIPLAASDRFLLELGPDDRLEEVLPTLERYEATAERAFPGLTLGESEDLAQIFVVRAPEERLGRLMEALREDVENVDFVERDFIVSLDPPQTEEAAVPASAKNLLANDPLAASQWWLDAIQADGAHRLLQNREPARKAIVAILDTGVDSGHEDLAEVFNGGPGSVDGNGHGTHCAGIAGAATNNGRGIASLNWDGRFVAVRSYNVLSKDGFGTSESIAQGIIDATRDGADVISMSLGAWSPTPPKVEVDAIRFARSRNVVVVAAAGNNAGDAREHAPSNIQGVISVAAVDSRRQKAGFSNENADLGRPLSAPGVDILSSKPGGIYLSHNGTSMATPMVAGLAGLLRSLDPSLSPDETYELIRNTARPVARGQKVGPILDAEAALRRLTEKAGD